MHGHLTSSRCCMNGGRWKYSGYDVQWLLEEEGHWREEEWPLETRRLLDVQRLLEEEQPLEEEWPLEKERPERTSSSCWMSVVS